MNFVKDVLDEREKSIISKRNLSMNIDKRIANLPSSSRMVPDKFFHVYNFIVSKGKLHKLLRKALIKDKRVDQKLMEREQKEAYELVSQLKRQIEELTYELGQTERQLESRVKDTEILQKL